MRHLTLAPGDGLPKRMISDEVKGKYCSLAGENRGESMLACKAGEAPFFTLTLQRYYSS